MFQTHLQPKDDDVNNLFISNMCFFFNSHSGINKMEYIRDKSISSNISTGTVLAVIKSPSEEFHKQNKKNILNGKKGMASIF